SCSVGFSIPFSEAFSLNDNTTSLGIFMADVLFIIMVFFIFFMHKCIFSTNVDTVLRRCLTDK
ncbi:MAG: hypothetical protein KAG20_01345, partial [Cocleimonas sp.]|nr:hypothetical protein [Cocleimonas sp.]